MTIQTVSGASCSSLPCTMSNPPIMVIGNTRVITVTATITAVGAFTNTATANGNDFDPDTSNNTSTAGGTAVASADVSLMKTLVTSGPFTASGGGCAALPCTIASLASGANVTINVTATLTAAGAFDNSATATATEFDPNTNNNTDNTGNGGTTGTPTIDLAITKTAPAAPVVDAPFDYTLVVTNHGPSTATGVTVTDPLPANFVLISTSTTQGSCSGTTTITCNLGTILNGASATITIHGVDHTAGPLSNTATVTGNETDTVPANNSSTVAVNVVEDVPALSGFGLMLLALSLAIAAAMVLRQRG